MRKIWEMYENLNEIVYMMDMNSYELLYMNRRAREEFGLGRKEYQGRKCYEILQGYSRPCTICDNGKLQEGEFLEWRQCHPILGKVLDRKCTRIEVDGRACRFELAIDRGEIRWQKESEMEFYGKEAMINELLRVSLQAETPEKSIAVFLEYLGQFLKSDRVYIFEENAAGKLSNTYEWCARGISVQKENLESVPIRVLQGWYRKFKNRENVIIQDIEAVKDEDPEIYHYLYPQNIRSLVVSPLVMEKKIIGFYGADNPPEEFLGNIATVFQIMGHFIVSLLRRRNLVKSLEQMSYYDQLTGIGNRHAMHEYIASLDSEESIGVLYCDVMGLKKVNDTKGHQAGDDLLLRACCCLQEELKGYALFRIGGDEFLALGTGMSKQELGRKAAALKRKAEEMGALMAVGSVWCSNSRGDLDQLIARADSRMYEDKRSYYDNTEKWRREEELCS